MVDSTYRTHNQDPAAIAHRLIQKAQNRDGLHEIVAGVILLTFAGLYGLQMAFPSRSHIYKASNAAVLAAMMLLVILIYPLKWAIKKVRTRYLIGKIGYVKLKPLNRRGLGIVFGIAFVVAAFVAAAMVYLVRSRHLSLRSGWWLAEIGISGGLYAMVAGHVAGHTIRYYIGGGLLAAIGILLAFSPVPLNVGMTILLGFMGLFCLVSGGVALTTLLLAPAEPGE